MKSNVKYVKRHVFTNPKDGVVVVKLDCEMILKNMPDFIMTYYYYGDAGTNLTKALTKLIDNGQTFSVIGRSKVNTDDGDVFDEKKGVAIALTRAQAEAQLYASRFYAKMLDILRSNVLFEVEELCMHAFLNYKYENRHSKILTGALEDAEETNDEEK